jgi:hypothetical protein
MINKVYKTRKIRKNKYRIKRSVSTRKKRKSLKNNKYSYKGGIKDNEMVLTRFVHKIKNQILEKPNISGKIRKHKKLELFYLKSICGDVGICLSLNNHYEEIMDMFDNFFNFDYLINSPKEISRGANGIVRLLKYQKTVEDISFNSYLTLKIPRTPNSDNICYEYLVGKLCVNYLCKMFPVFFQTYNLYELETISMEALTSPTPKSKDASIFSSMNTVRYPEDIDKICQKPQSLLLTGQFYDNFISIDEYTQKIPKNNNFDFPFILFQIYYALHNIKDVFTHYDLHTANVGLIKLPDGYHIDYEYETKDSTGNPVLITFKNKYIVKIIDYGKSYFRSLEHPYITSKEIIENMKKNGCLNVGDKDDIVYVDSTIKNESHDLELFYHLYDIYNYDTTPIPNFLYINPFGTPENKDNLSDGTIRNVTDAHNFLCSFILSTESDLVALNERSYLDSISLGKLKVYGMGVPMEFLHSVRIKKRGDQSRFSFPDIPNVNI